MVLTLPKLKGLPNIKKLLVDKQQMNLDVVPPSESIIEANVLDLGGEVAPHPLRKFQIILVFRLG